MKLNQEKISKALEFAYDKALNGVSGFDSAYKLAADYKNDGESAFENANSLIRWQKAKAAANGFVTGLGGLVTMPIALPVNITSVLFIQIRMIAAIAALGGYDMRNDKVKTLVYCCLVASSSVEAAKRAGIKIGEKIATKLIHKIPREVIVKINQTVGFRLLTKFGGKGVGNLGKCVPIIGGAAGAAIDYFSTNKIGNVARDIFTPK